MLILLRKLLSLRGRLGRLGGSYNECFDINKIVNIIVLELSISIKDVVISKLETSYKDIYYLRL